MITCRRRISSGVWLVALLTGCAAAGDATSTDPSGSRTPAGHWTTTSAAAGALVEADLTLAGAAIGGKGTITVNIPAYTGDDFTVASGGFSDPAVTFAGPLGANPDGHGGFYIGSMSFTGSMTTATTIVGTLTYTPPRTATQTFTAQTVTGVTLTKN